MLAMADRHFRVLREIARATFDDGGGVPEERLDFMERELRLLFACVGALARLALRLSVAVVQLAPLLVIGRPRRFTALAPAQRVRFLQRFESGLFATLFVALRMYMAMAYFEHPQGGLDAGVASAAAPASANAVRALPALKEVAS